MPEDAVSTTLPPEQKVVLPPGVMVAVGAVHSDVLVTKKYRPKPINVPLKPVKFVPVISVGVRIVVLEALIVASVVALVFNRYKVLGLTLFSSVVVM